MGPKQLFAFCCIFAGVSVAAENDFKGFEFVGVADGKVFLQPIRSDTEQWGLYWKEALELCVSNGFRMAAIGSQAQNDAIESWMTRDIRTMRKWSWIDGISFISARNDWFSIHTGQNVTYLNWAAVPGIPAKDDGVRCLAWANREEGVGMFDGSCTGDWNNVICETPSV